MNDKLLNSVVIFITLETFEEQLIKFTLEDFTKLEECAEGELNKNDILTFTNIQGEEVKIPVYNYCCHNICRIISEDKYVEYSDIDEYAFLIYKDSVKSISKSDLLFDSEELSIEECIKEYMEYEVPRDEQDYNYDYVLFTEDVCWNEIYKIMDM